MYISIDNIIRIIIILIQVIFYLIIFFKLHKLKKDTPLSLADILAKGKEIFTQIIGKVNGDKVIDKLINQIFPTEKKEEEENKDNG